MDPPPGLRITGYDSLISDPLVIRQVAELMLQTCFLMQFSQTRIHLTKARNMQPQGHGDRHWRRKIEKNEFPGNNTRLKRIKYIGSKSMDK